MRAELVSAIAALVFGIVVTTVVGISGIADGIIDGDGCSGGDDGAIDDDCSGNGANGTLGENGGFMLLIGACATVGCSLLANGTATVGVIGCPDATATGFKRKYRMKNTHIDIAKI